jgi:hypothetical protein
VNDEDRYHGVLTALSELHAEWQQFKGQLSGEITEYRKTVNSAISILGQEAIKFQHDTEQRLSADSAQREQRQRKSDRKDIAVLIGMGCLIVMNFIGIGVAIGTIVWMLMRSGL